jgi:hypothetical protein
MREAPLVRVAEFISVPRDRRLALEQTPGVPTAIPSLTLPLANQLGVDVLAGNRTDSYSMTATTVQKG